MSQRLLNIGILVSFLGCYLEWGGGNSAFVAQAEYQVLIGSPDARNFAHPMIAVPAIGQLLVLCALFQKSPSRRLTSVGIILMSALVLLLVLIAVLGTNARIGLATLPFLTLAVIHFTRSKLERPSRE
jgi:O-antigen ligase